MCTGALPFACILCDFSFVSGCHIQMRRADCVDSGLLTLLDGTAVPPPGVTNELSRAAEVSSFARLLRYNPLPRSYCFCTGRCSYCTSRPTFLTSVRGMQINEDAIGASCQSVRGHRVTHPFYTVVRSKLDTAALWRVSDRRFRSSHDLVHT